MSKGGSIPTMKWSCRSFPLTGPAQDKSLLIEWLQQMFSQINSWTRATGWVIPPGLPFLFYHQNSGDRNHHKWHHFSRFPQAFLATLTSFLPTLSMSLLQSTTAPFSLLGRVASPSSPPPFSPPRGCETLKSSLSSLCHYNKQNAGHKEWQTEQMIP